MIVRSLDANGDWTFGQGKSNYFSGQKAIMQLIRTRLLEFLGDCFFSVDEGIDYWTFLSGKDQLSFELAIRTTILNTQGVTGIISANVNYDPLTRRIDMQYTVTTIYTGVGTNQTVGAPSGQTTFLLTEDGSILTTEDGSGIEGG